MRSDQNQVTLKDMILKSAGQFRCEISAEAPLFNTVSQSRPLTIIGKKHRFDLLYLVFCNLNTIQHIGYSYNILIC